MEEQVGALWHRLITRAADSSYPQAEVRLADMGKRLGLFFRALGGSAGLQLEVAEAVQQNLHRNWLQRIAGTGNKIHTASMDHRALRLPPRIAIFDSRQLNRDLYYWLAAVAAHQHRLVDPRMDNWLNRNQLSTLATLNSYPGLEKRYQRLVSAHLEQRPNPEPLRKAEQAQELAIRCALLEPGSITWMPEASRDPYPVPLWLYHAGLDDADSGPAAIDNGQEEDKKKARSKDVEDIGRRRAKRVKLPEKNLGLVTIRMENIFTWGEFVNVDRGHEDEEDAERAESIARDLDELAISQDQASSSIRLRFDLDLPSEAEDDRVLNDGILLPEWDWKTKRMQEHHCRVIEMVARDAEAVDLPDELKPTARKLKNQFQRLTPQRTWLHNQSEGQEIDLEAYQRFAAERMAGLAVEADGLYRDLKQGNRDLACLLLADLSLSTDTWVSDEQRVIDVIRDSLWLFAESLDAIGDRFSMLGFSSRKRDPIRMHQLKRFDESYSATVRGRIGQIKPGYYTRLGAAIRYASGKLVKQPATRQLLLILTDGKPNDLDKYEGRYGIEDTHQAIIEARRLGLTPFCVTIDVKGNDYLPYLFGKNGYIVIHNPLQMPKYLPRLYMMLTRS